MTPVQALIIAVARMVARQRPILGHGVVGARQRAGLDAEAMEGPPAPKADLARLAACAAARRGAPAPVPLTDTQAEAVARSLLGRHGADAGKVFDALGRMFARAPAAPAGSYGPEPSPGSPRPVPRSGAIMQ